MTLLKFPIVLIGIALSILISGCSSNSASSANANAFVAPNQIEFNIETLDDINAYGDQQARPIVIRIYQLSESGVFENTEFLDLFSKDRESLAETLIDVTSLAPMLPGKVQQLTLDVQQKSRFIAVLGEFADYANAEVKAYVALVETPEKYPVYIRVSGKKIAISQPVDEAWWKVF
ncbi:lipoprotein, putative [Marinomonas sp. MED121]|uniref:type VI secretion system lipoprotein TssJ n=1 Tax=Marinomonas sp. MED121 TaxID=314277 RepID=UPI00006903A0|nr:type VI secretion system lipoprotein TssJ [Marinomonas sp. MED121]EAQ66486.1 lipoprotein, putative [Marinomonas sp. MED121]